MLLVRDTFDLLFFFFNDTATTEIYTLSLHDALPISAYRSWAHLAARGPDEPKDNQRARKWPLPWHKTRLRERSEEHTSELQSLAYLVCRLLLEKKKKTSQIQRSSTTSGTLTMNRSHT